MNHSTPDLLVEKLQLGELSPAEAAAVRARLERDGELHRLDALALAAEVAPEAMPGALAERIARAQSRDRNTRARQGRSWSLAVGAACCAVMALVIALPRAHDTSATRAKGGDAALLIYRQTGNAFQPLSDGASAAAGDRLQLRVSPGERAHARAIAIYSIDGRGVVTEHLAPRPVLGAEAYDFDGGFMLDDAPRFERFFLVLGLADDALDARDLERALARIAAGPDPETAPLVIDGARVVTRIVIKDPPR